MKTEIKHSECNGWVIVTKDNVDCENAANYHLVEANISKGSDEQKHVTHYNYDKVTCCNLPLVKDAKYLKGFVYFQPEVHVLRSTLAEKQNGDWEICGNCVGHFYKDNK